MFGCTILFCSLFAGGAHVATLCIPLQRMPEQGRLNVTLLFSRPYARLISSLVFVCLLLFTSTGAQEARDTQADVLAQLFPKTSMTITSPARASTPRASENEALNIPLNVVEAPSTEGNKDGGKSQASAVHVQAEGLPIKREDLAALDSYTKTVNGGNNYIRSPPMTVAIVVGAGETLRDCKEEVPSQSFLMGVARRFQQLQLLPLLVAFGQQSLRVVTSHGRIPPLQHGMPDPLFQRSHQPQLLVEVASKAPLLQPLSWRTSTGLKLLAPKYMWPKSAASSGSTQRTLARQNSFPLLSQPHRVPSAETAVGAQVRPLLPALLGGSFFDEQQPLSFAAGPPPGGTPQGGGSFVGGMLQALKGIPLRVNLGDMACAALPTNAFNRKLSCWLLGAFTERILCRTAWYDPCQAISEEATNGKPLLSPVIMPPGGSSLLALSLEPLLAQRSIIPKIIPKDVALSEGRTYQLLWQALTRLDDMWALAYCGRDFATYSSVGRPRQDPMAEKKKQQQQLQGQNRRLQKKNADIEAKYEKSTAMPQTLHAELPEDPLSSTAQEPKSEAAATEVKRNFAQARGSTDIAEDPSLKEAAGLQEAQQSNLPPFAYDREHVRPSGAAEELAEDLPVLEGQDLLPGWHTELILKALSPGIGNRTNVLAVVGRRGTEVLIAFRGTKTQVEWILNGQAEHAFNWMAEGEGRTAAGFSHIFSAAWPALQVYLASLTNQVSPISRILVTGYSLGGAVAALMAYGIALSYPNKVDAVIYGSPRAGDKAFAEAWARRVNGRSVAFTLDPIPRTPCKEMPACDKPGTRGPLTLPPNFLKWVPTSPRMNGGSGIADGPTVTNGYGDFYGLVGFGPEELGGSARRRVSSLYISYNHICAYPCWLATQFNPVDRRTFCEMPDFSRQWDPALPPDTCPALLS